MPYDKSTQKKYGENPLPQKKSGFKMKGSPMKRNFGIGADSPMKETTTPSYTGANIDPKLSYEYKGVKMPSFRDMISLEQQQAYADKVDARRAKRKEDREKKSKNTRLDKKEAVLAPGLNEESVINKSMKKFDPLAEDKVKYGNVNTQHLDVDMPIGKYAKQDPNKTYSTLGGSTSDKSKKTNIQGSLS